MMSDSRNETGSIMCRAFALQQDVMNAVRKVLPKSFDDAEAMALWLKTAAGREFLRIYTEDLVKTFTETTQIAARIFGEEDSVLVEGRRHFTRFVRSLIDPASGPEIIWVLGGDVAEKDESYVDQFLSDVIARARIERGWHNRSDLAGYPFPPYLFFYNWHMCCCAVWDDAIETWNKTDYHVAKINDRKWPVGTVVVSMNSIHHGR